MVWLRRSNGVFMRSTASLAGCIVALILLIVGASFGYQRWRDNRMGGQVSMGIQEWSSWIRQKNVDAGIEFLYPDSLVVDGGRGVVGRGQIAFIVELFPVGRGDGTCEDPDDIDCRQQLWIERKTEFADALMGAQYRYRIGDEMTPVLSKSEEIAGNVFVRVVNAGIGECSLDYIKSSDKGFLAFRIPLCDDPGLAKSLGSGLGRSETADQEAWAAAEALLNGANAPRIVQERIDVLRQVLATVVMD